MVPWLILGGQVDVPPVPLREVLDSIFVILEEVDEWGEERLEVHRARLESAETQLLGLISVGTCQERESACDRNTLPGSLYCTRHQ